MKIHRQGDVGLMLVSDPEKTKDLDDSLAEAKKSKDRWGPRIGNGVLAEGERTGHAHRLAGDFAHLVVGSNGYVRIGEDGAQLTHEEHGTTTKLLPGRWYKSTTQREFAGHQVRLVRD